MKLYLASFFHSNNKCDFDTKATVVQSSSVSWFLDAHVHYTVVMSCIISFNNNKYLIEYVESSFKKWSDAYHEFFILLLRKYFGAINISTVTTFVAII